METKKLFYKKNIEVDVEVVCSTWNDFDLIKEFDSKTNQTIFEIKHKHRVYFIISEEQAKEIIDRLNLIEYEVYSNHFEYLSFLEAIDERKKNMDLGLKNILLERESSFYFRRYDNLCESIRLYLDKLPD